MVSKKNTSSNSNNNNTTKKIHRQTNEATTSHNNIIIVSGCTQCFIYASYIHSTLATISFFNWDQWDVEKFFFCSFPLDSGWRHHFSFSVVSLCTECLMTRPNYFILRLRKIYLKQNRKNLDFDLLLLLVILTEKKFGTHKLMMNKLETCLSVESCCRKTFVVRFGSHRIYPAARGRLWAPTIILLGLKRTLSHG